MADRLWYYARNQQKVGPVPLSELHRLATSGQLQPTDMVLEQGAQKWITAGAALGLFSSRPQATTPSRSAEASQSAPLSINVQECYWLLVGNLPSGPFTAEQVHAKLAAGEVTWETRACRLGDSTWLPLVQTPGLGPTSVLEVEPLVIPVRPRAVTAPPERLMTALPADEVVQPAQSRGSRRTDRSQSVGTDTGQKPSTPATNWVAVVVGVLTVAFFGWIVYGWLRPLTPREVCERVDKAKTAQEAKKYCTLNLHPALEAIYRQKLPDSDDPFEYTQESEAPADVGGYFVGVRWQGFIPEERRRVQIDGVIHLIKSDGWKIEDIYLLSADRQPLPEPFSLASSYHLFTDQQPATGQVVQPASRSVNSNRAKAWYDDPNLKKLGGRATAHWFSSGGGKWLGGLFLAACAAIAAFWKKIARGEA